MFKRKAGECFKRMQKTGGETDNNVEVARNWLAQMGNDMHGDIHMEDVEELESNG